MATSNYSYYKGQQKNPYNDKGKFFWWNVEKEAYDRGDEKKEGELSMSMALYIKEKLWLGDGQPDTTLEEMYKRAQQMYNDGIWSRHYLCLKKYTYKEAIAEN